MRRLFVAGIVGLACFELANVYFVMPLPYSQRMRSVELAYALYTWRWAVRLVLGAVALAGLRSAWRASSGRWLVPTLLAAAGGVAYVVNFRMSADRMFREPAALDMQPASRNSVDPARLVVGIELEGSARAYPVQFIGYHHQVRDTVRGRPVLVTFCTVCRTGRVFDPVVDGRPERFRLVGMDHFNAMLEDRSTGSWWRQADGRAITGPRTGSKLTEIPSQQVTLAMWLTLHPGTLIMQADPALRERYASGFDYESGASRKRLTGTSSVSWSEKAWVVGLTAGGASKAYDWNRLRRERVINDAVGGVPVVIVLAGDGASFFAYERPDPRTVFSLRGDSLAAGGRVYAVSGRGPQGALRRMAASQEFWHSWRTFQPGTARY